MKKFFALVLALVMALSLTTMAWGVYGVEDKNTLPDAVGGVITLTENIEVTFNGENVPALAAGTVINGGGNTLTLNGNIGSYDTWAAITGKNLTINNLKIVNNLTNGRAIEIEGGSLNNVDITGGTAVVVEGTAAITLTICDFDCNAPILTDSAPDAPVHIDGCVFTAPAVAIVMRNADSSSVNSTYNANLSLFADGVTAKVTGNTFNKDVELYFEEETLTGNSFSATSAIVIDSSVDKTSIDVSGNYWGGSAPTAAQLGGATATTYATTVANDGTVGDLYYSSTNTPVNPPTPSVPVYPYYPPVVEDTTDKTVDSAQTFDAGIALYVGVSVLGAAGTVALGKKRED